MKKIYFVEKKKRTASSEGSACNSPTRQLTHGNSPTATHPRHLTQRQLTQVNSPKYIIKPYLCQWITSGSRIWSRGGPRNFSRDFADVAKRSWASEASQYWPGSRACLRALEALAFLTVKMCIFPLFLVLFLQKFNLHLCRHIHKISNSI